MSTAEPQDDDHEDAPQPPGLRERKRRRLRATLLRTARDVFAEHGYEATTIDEVAARADVSPRTVFRYFGSKEEMALAGLRDFYEALAAALSQRDPAEPPIEALAAAARAAWARPDAFASDDFRALLRLVEESPALLAALLRTAEEQERRLVAELARRAGETADELAIRVVVAVFLATVRVASDIWSEGDDPQPSALGETLDAALDRLRAQVAEEEAI